MKTNLIILLAGAALATLAFSNTSTAQSRPDATCKTFRFSALKVEKQGPEEVAGWMGEQLAAGKTNFEPMQFFDGSNMVCAW